jgi:hypothetical protein
MAYNVEYDSGEGDYRTVILRITDSYKRHRCGYVYVPENHTVERIYALCLPSQGSAIRSGSK